MTDNTQEKIAPASQKKLQQVKKQGYSAKSYDFSNFGVLLCGVLCMLVYFYFSQDFYKIANFNFQFNRDILFDNYKLIEHLKLSVILILKSLIPYFLIMIIITVIAHIVPGGFNFSIDSLKFKTDRINLAKGIARVFAPKNLLEVIILILKVIFMLSAIVGYYFLFKNYIVNLSIYNVNTSIINSIYYILITGLYLVMLLLVISLFDVPYRRYKFNKEIEMTYEEVKEEQKNNEGRAEVKSARKTAYKKLMRKKKSK